MFKEFKTFIMRGNVVDLAVGVIIGGAFGAIIASLVNDIIMPPIGLLLGNVNFSDLFINLTSKSYTSLDAAKKDGAAVIAYGNFINTLISFLIIALVVFLVIKAINGMTPPKPVPPPPPPTKDCPYCTMAIPIKASRCPNCTSQLADSGVPSGS
jgi:large conductance mechanosensitive channel